jgi:hypothetical protein
MQRKPTHSSCQRQDKIKLGFINFGIKGQYKASENGSNLITVITQGATSILIKALEDSNGLSLLKEKMRICFKKESYSFYSSRIL